MTLKYLKMKHYTPGQDKIPLPESSDEDESNDFNNENNHSNETESEEEYGIAPSNSDSEEEISDFDTKFHHNYSDDNISDSDSAPETFSFSVAEKSRKQAETLFTEAIRKQREDLKRKRKEILLKNLNQKEEKRKKIESKELLDDVETPESKLEEQQEFLKKNSNVEKEITETAGNVTFKCKVLTVEDKKPKFVPENIQHFKDKLLYSGRVKREKSNRDAVLKREKQSIKRQ